MSKKKGTPCIAGYLSTKLSFLRLLIQPWLAVFIKNIYNMADTLLLLYDVGFNARKKERRERRALTS
jgi:hypothetical protein